ncbi:MAG: sigma 54-interacting transcriptional regulator [Bacteroidota bacterium]
MSSTSESDRGRGMPEGRLGDDDPQHYFGLHLLNAIRDAFPTLPVIVLSSKPHEQVSRALEGIFGFLPREKAGSPSKLRTYIYEHGLLPDERGVIVGTSVPLLLALRAARKAALDPRNLLIRGEPGVGKESMADYLNLHALVRTRKKDRPLVKVNAAVLTPELYASALFGHKKGAFTGATRDHTGYIKEADGGDLFLDEIKDAPPAVQAGLLRALQEREVTPVGSTETVPVHVRFLSATNADVETLVQEGSFRSDLLARLREGDPIMLPPLRERLDDLPPLVEAFLRKAEQMHPRATKGRTVELGALEKLRNHTWPENIRELQRCLFNAVYNYPDAVHLFPAHIRFDERPGDGALSGLSGTRRRVTAPDIPTSSAPNVGLFQMNSADPAVLRDSLADLQALVAEYLSSALRTTSDPVTGKLVPTTAYKMIVERDVWTSNATTAAADLIINLLGIHPASKQRLLDDDAMLREAYEWAFAQRPQRSRKPKKRSK